MSVEKLFSNPYNFDVNEDALRFIPLGGIGEIGKNMFAYEYNGEIIIVDAGLLFPEQEMLGIDLVIPDISWLIENADKIHAILLTHGHEDHIGALPWVLNEINLPVWGTKLTLGLLKNKLTEHEYLPKTSLNVIDPDETLQFGSFTIQPFRVTHSIPDALGFIIETPAGRVVHSGDFKIDQTPLHGQRTEVQKIVQKTDGDVLSLMVDVTNVERTGWVTSESLVADTFDNIFADAEGRIIFATFASNISRMQEIINASHFYDRKVCVMGRSMIGNLEIARQLGYIKLPDPDIIVSPDKVNSLPPEQVTVLTTGSQGEPLSALRLISSGEHKYIKVGEGDLVVISATPIPGNEDLVYRTINQLFRQGAEVIYHIHDRVHVSGHGNQEEIKMMLTLSSPRYTVPMHGEFRHLVRFKKLAKSMGMKDENIFLLHSGDVLEMTRTSASVVGQVTAGRVMIDGLGVGDIGASVLRDRRLLSKDGMLIAIVGIDEQTGAVTSGPDIITRGFVYADAQEDLIEDAKNVIIKKLEGINQLANMDHETLKATIKTALNRFLNERTGRKPMVIPVVVR
jgi:ribonuclease J